MSVEILIGDCREVAKTLPDRSVNCIVTSPPYYGLRNYGTARWDGGDPNCDHAPRQAWIADGGDLRRSSAALPANLAKAESRRGGICHCGATRVDHQIGLERTPDEYIAAMVELFRELRRVLRDDGTLWLNIGDSYWSGKGASCGTDPKQPARRGWERPQDGPPPSGLKAKDLIGIPWMLAFALRADGWVLRQDIIWSKPNGMTESVRDRCTNSHEYLFLLAKSRKTTCWRHEDGRWAFDRPAPDYVWRHRESGEESATEQGGPAWRRDNRWRGFDYYYEADSIAEPLAESLIPRLMQNLEAQTGTSRAHAGGKTNGNLKAQGDLESGMRNKRSVWTVATQPFREAHFATFPPDLIIDCIKAGCPESGTVLDPFGGAGTTGLVASWLQRDAVLIELNPEYAALARRRIDRDRGGLFVFADRKPRNSAGAATPRLVEQLRLTGASATA